MTKQKRENQLSPEIKHQMKQLDEEYLQAFQSVVSLIMKDDKRSEIDKNVLIHLILQQCNEGMKQHKKVLQVIPRQVEDYITKTGRGPRFKQMKKQIRDQDYEKFIISSIWILFSQSIVLFFFKNLIMNQFLIHYIVDVVIACLAGGLAISNYQVKYRIINKYDFGRFTMKVDIIALICCIFIKIVSPSNFDMTYLLLVIAFFMIKRKIKPQFEQVID